MIESLIAKDAGMAKVYENSCWYERAEDQQSDSLELFLVRLDLDVGQHHEAHQQPGNRAAQMTDVAGVGVGDVVQDRWQRQKSEAHGEHEEVQHTILHLGPVEDEVWDESEEQRVVTSRCTDQPVVGIGYRCAQRTA